MEESCMKERWVKRAKKGRRWEGRIYQSGTDGELNRVLDGVIDTSSHQLLVVPGWAWWIHSIIDLPQQSWQRWLCFSCRLRVTLLWSSRCLRYCQQIRQTQSKAAPVTYRCLLLSFSWEGGRAQRRKRQIGKVGKESNCWGIKVWW